MYLNEILSANRLRSEMNDVANSEIVKDLRHHAIILKNGYNIITLLEEI